MEKWQARVIGGVEALLGTGLIVATALIPELKGAERALGYAIGGLAFVDGVPNIITGTEYFYDKLCDLHYHLEEKRKGEDYHDDGFQ